MIPETVESVL